jgi:hypothetical protein
MNLRDYPEVFGDTIFCDDIRQESGGKLSLMGCYSNIIVLHSPFPFIFPKFGFYITLVQRREVLDPNIKIKIFLPGDPEDAPSFHSEAHETTEGAVAEETARLVEGLPRSDQRVVTMHASIVAAPLTIKERGIIKVRVLRQGELIRLGGIRVVQQSDLPKS